MGVLHRGTGRAFRVPDRDLEEMVILDIMDDLILPQARYSVQFVLIYLLAVCQEWGVKKEDVEGS